MALPQSLAPLTTSLVGHDSVGGEAYGDLKLAAVLALLYPRGNGVSFVLTERPAGLTRHAGQVSLPGGVVEPEDASPWEASLRETREELGVRTGRIRPLGGLPPVQVQVTGYHILPFVGWSPVRPRLRPDPREVASVLEVDLELLLDRRSVETETWILRGARWRVSLFRFGDTVVWGATARILTDLAVSLGGQVPSPAPGSVLPAQ
jgi:8-oxo-dGTP pyrophosphatase MutT (NUDIX family)